MHKVMKNMVLYSYHILVHFGTHLTHTTPKTVQFGTHLTHTTPKFVTHKTVNIYLLYLQFIYLATRGTIHHHHPTHIRYMFFTLRTYAPTLRRKRRHNSNTYTFYNVRLWTRLSPRRSHLIGCCSRGGLR